MPAVLVYHSKVQLLHRSVDIVAVAELKVWKVLVSHDYPEGLKYSLFLVLKETGEIVLGFDNHRPKGHHFHQGKRQESFNFISVDHLIDEFWILTKKEGFLI